MPWVASQGPSCKMKGGILQQELGLEMSRGYGKHGVSWSYAMHAVDQALGLVQDSSRPADKHQSVLATVCTPTPHVLHLGCRAVLAGSVGWIAVQARVFCMHPIAAGCCSTPAVHARRGIVPKQLRRQEALLARCCVSAAAGTGCIAAMYWQHDLSVTVNSCLRH